MRGGAPDVDVLDAPPAPGLQRAVEALGPDAKERPAPDLFGALIAGGAVLVAAGVLILTAGDDGNRAGLLIGSALLVVAGYLVGAFAGVRLRPAAVALAAIGVVVFIFVAFEDSLDDGKLAAPLIVVALILAIMYAAPILRGRPLLLGLCLFSLVGCFTFLAAQGDIDSSIEQSTSAEVTDVGSTAVQSAYVVLLIAGVVLLIAAFLLDHAKYHGLATVFIAVAVISVLAGAAGVGSELGDTEGAFLVGFAGLALAVVGDLGKRRFTTWLGAIVVPYALVAMVLALVSDDDRIGGGILLVVFGLALAAVCFVLPVVWAARAERPAAPPPTTP